MRSGTVSIRPRSGDVEGFRSRREASTNSATAWLRLSSKAQASALCPPQGALRARRRGRQKPEGIGGRWRVAGRGKLVHLESRTASENRESPHINLVRSGPLFACRSRAFLMAKVLTIPRVWD